MAEIIQQVQERLVYAIKESKAEIIVPSEFPPVNSHALWVEEIWANYISNGIKYGGSPPKLELGFDMLSDENMVSFWVQDNGQGLAAEAQTKLFTPFTRLHQEGIEGHGLGLSIVQQIVERLGGKVGLDSEIGKGSKFYVAKSLSLYFKL